MFRTHLFLAHGLWLGAWAFWHRAFGMPISGVAFGFWISECMERKDNVLSVAQIALP